jgi:hypothetical protein
MVRKSKKKKEEAKIKRTRLNFQLKKAELFEMEITLDDAIEEFNDRFETGRKSEIVEPEPKEKEPSESQEMIEAEEKEEEEFVPEPEEDITPEMPDSDEVFGKDRDLKELFKKIALKTHPDKLRDLDEEEREYRISLYKEAANAVKKGDGATLLEIAYELSVVFDIDADKEVKWLNKKVQQLEQKMMEIKQTAEWIWYHSDGLNKNIVEKMVTDQLGFKFKSSSGGMSCE